jgi:hypothetical protein
VTRAQAARRRWEQLSPAERRERVEKLAAGRRRLSTAEGRAEKLAEVERELDLTGAEIDRLREAGEPVPMKLREKLRGLGDRRLVLKNGGPR